MGSEDREEKPFVRLEETDATTTDEDGNSRLRLESLSKGGEKEELDPVHYWVRKTSSGGKAFIPYAGNMAGSVN